MVGGNWKELCLGKPTTSSTRLLDDLVHLTVDKAHVS